MNKWMNVPETEWDSGKGKWLANDTAELYSFCPYSDTKLSESSFKSHSMIEVQLSGRVNFLACEKFQVQVPWYQKKKKLIITFHQKKRCRPHINS